MSVYECERFLTFLDVRGDTSEYTFKGNLYTWDVPVQASINPEISGHETAGTAFREYGYECVHKRVYIREYIRLWNWGVRVIN